MGEVPLVSSAEHSPSARGTEALQSCFCRPGRHSMTTGRRESSQIDFPSPRRSLRRLPPSARRGHPGPRGEKSGEKNRGGDITPIRLRRSLFFVAPATPAGMPSRRKPGESIKALPGRPGCGLPGAPRLPRPRRVRLVEKSRTGCAGAAGGRASAQAHRGRVFLANPASECPFGPPWVRKGCTTENRRLDRRARRPVTACLPGIARNCPELLGKNMPLSKCPRTVSRSRSASQRAPIAAAPVALRAASAAANAK